MVAYSIAMTIFTFLFLFMCCAAIAQKERERGRLIWSDQLRPGKYRVVAKSPCGTLAILETDDGYKHIGLKTCIDEIPNVGQTFQWKVKKLKGDEGKAVILE